jgi:hypothetical protein
MCQTQRRQGSIVSVEDSDATSLWRVGLAPVRCRVTTSSAMAPTT